MCENFKFFRLLDRKYVDIDDDWEEEKAKDGERMGREGRGGEGRGIYTTKTENIVLQPSRKDMCVATRNASLILLFPLKGDDHLKPL